jgi:tetratricopeptide (TPR) repeat protein
MLTYFVFLYQQSDQESYIAATLTMLELANLFVLLEQIAQQDDSETIIEFCSGLHSLLQRLGKSRLLARLEQVRDATEKTLDSSWSHASFEAQRIRVEQYLQLEELPKALESAQLLLNKASLAGEHAHEGADHDLAMAYFLSGQVEKNGGSAERPMRLFEEAFIRFDTIAAAQEKLSAADMASACLAESGGCLLSIGRYDEAVIAYEESIRRYKKLNNLRGIAVGKGQLGTVCLMQNNYQDALDAYTENRQIFEQLGEPKSVAIAWHQIGIVYEQIQQLEAAEQAYRQSLTINLKRAVALPKLFSLSKI